MQVGDYVRTKYGEVCKLKEPKYNGLIYSTDIEIDRYNDRDCNDYGFDNDTIKDIIKSSQNIIDLIEVGDYVNGQLVKHIAYFEGVEEPIKKLIFADEYHLIPTEVCEQNEIKSIVTKEQFASMEYKIGE